MKLQYDTQLSALQTDITKKNDQIEDLKLELQTERGNLENSRRMLQDLRKDYNRLFEKIQSDDTDLINTLQQDFARRQQQLDKMQDETQRLRSLRTSLQGILGKTNPDGKYRRDQELVEGLRELEQKYTAQQKELDTLRKDLQDSITDCP